MQHSLLARLHTICPRVWTLPHASARLRSAQKGLHAAHLVEGSRVTVTEAELQRISDARTRAADTLKRRRDEQGEDYYRQRGQDARDGSSSD